MIRLHVAAIVAFLQALGLRVYDSEAGRNFDGSVEVVTAASFPYVIVTVSSPVRDTERMVQARERHEIDFTVGYHGLNPASARWAAERVSSLAGSSPAVTGWTVWIESVTSNPLRADRDNPEQVVFSGSDGFTATTFPA